jgi:beta-xylosidase
VTWRDGWPVIGEDPDGDGKGQPVLVHARPDAGQGAPAVKPQVSDEFDGPSLSLMWTWNANPSQSWASLGAKRGALRLFPTVRTDGPALSIAYQPNVLRTRLSAERLVATALVDLHGETPGAVTGLAVLGRDAAFVAVARGAEGWEAVLSSGSDVLGKGVESIVERRPVRSGRLFLRVAVEPEARLRFATSEDGTTFTPIGGELVAREGAWVGSRLALFTAPLPRSTTSDFTDVDWFRVE